MARSAVNPDIRPEPRMVHVRLDPALHRRMRMVVAAEDTTVQDWMARVVADAVAERWSNVVDVEGAA